MRMFKADGFQVLDLQRDTLFGADILADRLDEDDASGKYNIWPGLEARLKTLHMGDTLVARKLNRLGHNLRHLVNIVYDLTGYGVDLKVLAGQGVNFNTMTANGQLLSGLLAALAKPKRELIVGRIHAGLVSARAHGRSR